ncbi:MAG: CoB--CoM heterodisulfide reductase iron-sulfur subunit B family protein [Treponemataceae bacterium]
MKFSYYPGCTLKTQAKDLDLYGHFAAEKLGFTLEEVKDWQCCGGAYSMAKDEIASKLSSVRALVAAKEAGQKLVTLCSACHNVIKQTNNDMKTDENMASKANNYMKLDTPYNGEATVLHYLEVLRDEIGFDKIKAAVTNKFEGKKIGAYYGCLLLRPNAVMAMDNPENPKIIEDFIRSIGAEPVMYPMRNECCGGYVTMEDKAMATKKSTAVLSSAKDAQADMIITACPLCLYNLNKNNSQELPTFYFTELLAAALGHPTAMKEGK